MHDTPNLLQIEIDRGLRAGGTLAIVGQSAAGRRPEAVLDSTEAEVLSEVAASFSRAANHARRLLIIRGDLCSRNGLAYHARAQIRLLESDFDIVGVERSS